MSKTFVVSKAGKIIHRIVAITFILSASCWPNRSDQNSRKIDPDLRSPGREAAPSGQEMPHQLDIRWIGRVEHFGGTMGHRWIFNAVHFVEVLNKSQIRLVTWDLPNDVVKRSKPILAKNVTDASISPDGRSVLIVERTADHAGYRVFLVDVQNTKKRNAIAVVDDLILGGHGRGVAACSFVWPSPLEIGVQWASSSQFFSLIYENNVNSIGELCDVKIYKSTPTGIVQIFEGEYESVCHSGTWVRDRLFVPLDAATVRIDPNLGDLHTVSLIDDDVSPDSISPQSNYVVNSNCHGIDVRHGFDDRSAVSMDLSQGEPFSLGQAWIGEQGLNYQSEIDGGSWKTMVVDVASGNRYNVLGADLCLLTTSPDGKYILARVRGERTLVFGICSTCNVFSPVPSQRE